MNISMDIETPALILDEERLDRNLQRMYVHLQRLGVPLRPHVKTAKSVDVVRRALARQPGGITVSTLKEAEHFFASGIRDIFYAVGIAPGKLTHVTSLIRRGADVSITLDGLAAARAVADVAAAAGIVIPVLIEIDVDGHRSGVAPSSELLLEVGRALSSSAHVELRGVMTHAGESYNCRSFDALRAMAEQERAGATRAAERLRAQGWRVPVVSVGSTPTATFATDLSGVTEVRAGVYMFQDLVMAGLGVCEVDDIALSVLVSVIGHQSERGWIITDGGWTALSRDRGTANQNVDQGYGVVCDVTGKPCADDLIVVSANQEHGVIGQRNGESIRLDRYPVGTLLRVLPNHACATGTQHEAYCVVAGARPEIRHKWPRFSGW